jgi:hypothetical protein
MLLPYDENRSFSGEILFPDKASHSTGGPPEADRTSERRRNAVREQKIPENDLF